MFIVCMEMIAIKQDGQKVFHYSFCYHFTYGYMCWGEDSSYLWTVALCLLLFCVCVCLCACVRMHMCACLAHSPFEMLCLHRKQNPINVQTKPSINVSSSDEGDVSAYNTHNLCTWAVGVSMCPCVNEQWSLSKMCLLGFSSLCPKENKHGFI